MMNSATVTVALALFGAAASGMSAGSAKVVNKCSYEVYLCNVPAEGGGFSQQDKTLSPGDNWSQTWTELSNGEGWSIKLSNSTSLESILQYEYTFHNDGTIWFDLSCVNGDPWPSNWELNADNGCDPKQTAYRYPTDDDYGMQACDQDASVELTLCPNEGSGSDSTSSASAPSYSSASSSAAPAYTPASSSAAPVPTSAPASTSVAPIASPPAPSATSHTSAGGWGWFSNGNGGEVVAQHDHKPAATTLATSTIVAPVVNEDGSAGLVTVVDVVTAYETAVVTAFARDAPEAPGRHRRHEHHHAHYHA